MRVQITENGITVLKGSKTTTDAASIHVPAAIGAATVSVGWVDSAGTFNAYVDGVLAAGESAKFSTGASVPLAINIASFSTVFDIEVGI